MSSERVRLPRRAGYERHGMSLAPEYRAWADMVQRCLNEKCPNYVNYGARGISVDPAWAASFIDFLACVGFRPSRRHSIERINNGDGYVPGNVRWATKSEQNANKRVCGNSKNKGVSYRKQYGVWRAYLSNPAKHIGTFKTEADAVLAYNREAASRGLPLNPIPTLVVKHEQ